MLALYDRSEEVLGSILRKISATLLAVLVLLLAFNIVNRYVGWVTMAWYEEIVTLCFGWMVFLGAAELWRMRAHFKVDYLFDKLPGEHNRAVVQLSLDVICTVFLLIVLIYGIRWIASIRSTTPALKMPTGAQYAAIPVSMALMFVMTIRDIVKDIQQLLCPK